MSAADAPPTEPVTMRDDICPLGPVDPSSIPDAEHEKGAHAVFTIFHFMDPVVDDRGLLWLFCLAAPWVVRKLVGVSGFHRRTYAAQSFAELCSCFLCLPRPWPVCPDISRFNVRCSR